MRSRSVTESWRSASSTGEGAGEGRLERGEGELVRAHGPGQGVPGEARDDLGVAQQDPGLRAAEQLVAGGDDQIRAVAQGGGGVGFVRQLWLGGEQAAAEIRNQRDSGLPAGAGELAQGPPRR